MNRRKWTLLHSSRLRTTSTPAMLIISTKIFPCRCQLPAHSRCISSSRALPKNDRPKRAVKDGPNSHLQLAGNGNDPAHGGFHLDRHEAAGLFFRFFENG